MSIPSKYIDYDLTDIPDGQTTGLIEQTDSELMARTEELFGETEYFSAAFPEKMVPRSEWKARAEATAEHFRKTTKQIYSQGRTSACVGFGCGQWVETFATRLFGGGYHTPLAGMDVYSDISRTLMSGAYVPDGVHRVAMIGVLPLRTSETSEEYSVTYPGLDYKWRRPSGWEKVAAKFKVTRWAKCSGAEEVASALLNGFPLVLGRSRHCIPYVYLDFNGNSPMAVYANSWSESWGDDGFGADSERTFGNVTCYAVLDLAIRPEIEIPELI